MSSSRSTRNSQDAAFFAASATDSSSASSISALLPANSSQPITGSAHNASTAVAGLAAQPSPEFLAAVVQAVKASLAAEQASVSRPDPSGHSSVLDQAIESSSSAMLGGVPGQDLSSHASALWTAGTGFSTQSSLAQVVSSQGRCLDTVAETMTTTEQGQGKTAPSETPTCTVTSASAAGTSRRARIKPAVVPVARATANHSNQDRRTTGVRDIHVAADKKEANLSVSQGHKTSSKGDKDKTLLSSEEENQKDSSTEGVSNLPFLKDRCQQANSRCAKVVSLSVTNSEKRSQPVAEEPVIRPSQSQNKNTNCDSGNEGGTFQSLTRRKRVLPNLGSASRRRHSSVSKENVEKIIVARVEEIVTTEKDLEDVNEQSPVECSSSRNKRLPSLSEEENKADHGESPAGAVSEEPDKGDIEEEENDEEEEEEEINTKRKGMKRKRGSRPPRLKEPSDPSQMTMQHLIYFNPKTNPMTSSAAGRKKKGSKKRKSNKENDSQNEKPTEECSTVNKEAETGSPARTNQQQNDKEMEEVDKSDANGISVAPRVMLDSDGNIIVDEESLVIPKAPEKNLADSEIVYEDADEVNYLSYLKPRRVERWSLEETQKFYKALSQVGTDFSLMGPLFPNRIRRELKAKFKREEKLHRSLIEKALCVRNPIEVELFTPKDDGEEVDDDVASNENSNSIELVENSLET